MAKQRGMTHAGARARVDTACAVGRTWDAATAHGTAQMWILQSLFCYLGSTEWGLGQAKELHLQSKRVRQGHAGDMRYGDISQRLGAARDGGTAPASPSAREAEPFGFAPPPLSSHPQNNVLPVWQGHAHCFAPWTWYFHRDSPPFSNDIPILSPLPGPAHSWETR